MVIPATIGRPKARLSLVVPGRTGTAPDPALIAMVAQARGWLADLASGAAGSFTQIAARDGVTPGYVRQTIGAAFLASDLVTAIVEGRQHGLLTAGRLKALLPLPSYWGEQRVMVSRMV